MIWSQPSPFVFDGPVEPSMLIGRDAEADALRAWARAGRSITATTSRGTGSRTTGSR